MRAVHVEETNLSKNVCASPTHAILLQAPHECRKARKDDGSGRTGLVLESCHLTMCRERRHPVMY